MSIKKSYIHLYPPNNIVLSKKKKIVIIPTYNEYENIEKVCWEVLSLKEGFDILVVDDSSPDGTSNLVELMMEDYPKRLFLEIRDKKDGLGRAYIHGFKWAIEREYDYIFEMDADLSHNPQDLPRLLQTLDKEADTVIGSRYCNGVNVVNWPMSRVLMSYFASQYVQLITGMPIKDSTAGFVGYTREILKDINLDKIKFKGYAFQIEMKYRIWLQNYSIAEVPIIFTDRTHGESKINGSIIWEGVFGIIKLRIRALLGIL